MSERNGRAVNAMKPAVFVDRDGTMIQDVNYLSRADQVAWFSWTIDAIRLLNRAGYLVFVVTNQGGIGLGYTTEDFVRATHADLTKTLDAAGARVDGWYFCPHHPDAVDPDLARPCECRKPGRGMIDLALKDHEIDLARSFTIGDKAIDVALGTNVGARGILVKTGYGETQLTKFGGAIPGAAFVAEDLMSAVSWILRTPQP
jgi:D-glycero-D-manno-heptose 1,7-bisphosphate phosphatase